MTNKEEEEFFNDPKNYIEATVNKIIASKEKFEIFQKYVDEVMLSDSNYSDKTKRAARLIAELYPKLDKMDAYELTVPFVFAIARKLEEFLEEEIPTEFK